MTDADLSGPPVLEAPSARPVAMPPDLPATFVAPDRCAFLAAPDGALLRFAVWRARAAAPRGTALILTGRGEFVEKYAMEIAGELLGRGFAVCAADWRGQGLSSRLLDDRQKGHIDRFETYLGDLGRLLHGPVAALPNPVLALTHSMGGHLALRHLAETGAASTLAGAFLAAPMTGLRREAMLRTLLVMLPERPATESRFVYGNGPFRYIGREFIGNRVTHDARRFRFTDAWFRADSRLALGGPTIGWLRQAARSIRALERPGFLERVARPVMLLSAGQDQLVDSASHAPTAARIPGAELVPYPDARHEIMMESDAIRARFWADFDRFAARIAP